MLLIFSFSCSPRLGKLFLDSVHAKAAAAAAAVHTYL